MNKFQFRSDKKELLDGDAIPFEAIKQNMEELNSINTYSGGHSITLEGIKHFISKEKKLRVCEIGCGGGDNLQVLHKWFEGHGFSVELIGIDINKECIEFAESQNNVNIKYIVSDYKKVHFAEPPDVIFSSLFCHHFTNDELKEMMLWMKENSHSGFFINDLHRHPISYYFIKIVTRLFSKSYLVKHDAPLSILRSFIKKEWEQILTSAGLKDFTISWKWAFRYLIIYKNG